MENQQFFKFQMTKDQLQIKKVGETALGGESGEVTVILGVVNETAGTRVCSDGEWNADYLTVTGMVMIGCLFGAVTALRTVNISFSSFRFCITFTRSVVTAFAFRVTTLVLS